MGITTKKIRHNVEFIIIKILLFVLNLVPYKIALRFGDFFGMMAFSVFRFRRKVTLENLEKSFGPKYTISQYRKIGSRTYRNIVKSIIEFGLFPSLKKKNLSELISIEGQEHLQKLKSDGKGAVLVTGHFGSWELLGAFISQNGWPIDYLVGEQHNLKVNELMNSHRQMYGIGLIEMGVAARGVIKAIRAGRMVAMLSDQDAGSDGVIVQFMGRPASTPKGPAAFALKTATPIIFGCIVRGNGMHKVIIKPPLVMEPSGNKDDDIKTITQAYTSLLEKFIIENPDHWFWPHRRWKSTS